MSAANPELHRAIARMSIEQLRELEAMYARARSPDAPQSDAELAIQLARQEAESAQAIGRDHALAQQLQETEDLGFAMAAPRAAGQAAPLRNAVAFQRAPDPPVVNRATAPKSNDGWLSSTIGFVMGWFAATPPPQSNGNTSTPDQGSSRRSTGHTCVICQDPIYGVEIRAPCGHHYDVPCALELFEASTRDESLYPPRCCRQNIPLSSMEKHMKPAVLTLFNEKALEFGTKKRVYCSSPICSRFLCEQNAYAFWTGYIVTCAGANCTAKTCTKCKNRVQDSVSHRCQADQKEEGVLAMGQQSGWARCPGCEQLIELNLGCYHMTCRCKTEFCYLCRALWKNCRCPQWDERRLLLTAEARVDAQLNARGRNGEGWNEARHAPAPAANVVRPAAVPAIRPVLAPPVRRPAPAPPVRPVPAPPRSTVQAGSSRTNTNTQLAPPPYPGVVAPPPYEASQNDTVTSRLSWASVASGSHHVNAAASSNTIRKISSSTGKAVQKTQAKAGPSRGVTSTERARLVREAMAELRVNHECEHKHWRYRQGGGRCETCSHHLPLYLFRCGGCQILACNRCRRNRL